MIRSQITLTGILARGNERAGIFLVDSRGKVSRIEASGNRFGLVLQGDQVLALDLASFKLEGNREKDLVVNGNLLVPDQPAAIPEVAASP